MLKYIAVALLIAPLAAQAAPTDEKRERLICKRELATGSLTRPKRTCLTAEDWVRTKRLNRETLEEWQNKMNAKMEG